MTLSL